jgi:hypothetical protein
MTTSGLASLEVLDQRLDALDRALLGLVPRSERIELVASVEKRLREKYDADPAAIEAIASAAESDVAPLGRTSGQGNATTRKRSRLALSSGVLGIVAMGLLMLLPVTYVVIATIADSMGEVPAIALISLNVISLAGTGLLAGILSLAAMVRLSRSTSKKRGFGWAITGLCTSPAPAVVGMLAFAFFLVPISVEYVSSNSSHSGQPYVASLPPPLPPNMPPALPASMPYSAPVSMPVMIPQSGDCSNGACQVPPSLGFGGNSLTSYPPPPSSVPNAPVAVEGVSKPYTVTEVKAESRSPLEVKQEVRLPSGEFETRKIDAVPGTPPGPPSEAPAGSP